MSCKHCALLTRGCISCDLNYFNPPHHWTSNTCLFYYHWMSGKIVMKPFLNEKRVKKTRPHAQDKTRRVLWVLRKLSFLKGRDSYIFVTIYKLHLINYRSGSQSWIQEFYWSIKFEVIRLCLYFPAEHFAQILSDLQNSRTTYLIVSFILTCIMFCAKWKFYIFRFYRF